jgi:hypothetical protein
VVLHDDLVGSVTGSDLRTRQRRADAPVTARRTGRAGAHQAARPGALVIKRGHPGADARATHEGDLTVQEASEHRADVVRRLLERGLSEPALRTLFPGWDELITRVTAEQAPAADAPRASGS